MSGMRSDPFGERRTTPLRRRLVVLGAVVDFESSSARLMRLVEDAFANLPNHRWKRNPPRFTVRLVLAAAGRRRRAALPAPQLAGAAGTLLGVMDANNFALLAPDAATALVSVSRPMLRFPRLVRYELIEFAVLTLLARSLPLVALHAGCLGRA